MFLITLESLCDSLFALGRRFDETDLSVNGFYFQKSSRRTVKVFDTLAYS